MARKVDGSNKNTKTEIKEYDFYNVNNITDKKELYKKTMQVLSICSNYQKISDEKWNYEMERALHYDKYMPEAVDIAPDRNPSVRFPAKLPAYAHAFHIIYE